MGNTSCLLVDYPSNSNTQLDEIPVRGRNDGTREHLLVAQGLGTWR